MWEDIIALPLPRVQVLYCVTTAITHYGRGIAYAALGDLESAIGRERELYRVARKKTIPPTRKDCPNLITDVLKVADAMLDGEIQYRQRGFDRAFESLRMAIHKVR